MDIIRANYRDLYCFAFRMTGNHETAEDIVQETFYKYSRKNPDLPHREAIRRWLFVAIRNLCIDWLRKKTKAPILSTEDETELSTDALNPADVVLKTEQEQMIQQAVLSLPPLQREALILREYEQMSYRDIAEVTGSPIGTIRSRLAKARNELRIRLRPLLQDL